MMYGFYDICIGIIASLIAFMIFLVSLKKHPELKTVLIFAFVLRIAMAWVYTFWLDADPDGYAEVAEGFTELDNMTFLKSFQTGAYLYSWFIAAVWRITGVNTILIRIINALISYYCCILGYKLSKDIFNDNERSKKVLLIMAIFPSLIRFSSPFASRETVFLFVLMLSLRLLFKYYKNRKIKTALGFFAISVIGIIIHISMACLYVVFIAIMLSGIKRRSDFIKIIALAMAMIVGIVFMLKNNIGTEKLYLNKGGISNDKIAWIQEASAEGRAAYLSGFSSSNPVITMIQLPIRIVYFLYTPFVWMVSQPIDILGFLDAILYIWITIRILKGRSKYASMENGRFAIFMFIGILSMIVLMSVGTSNYGTALRHRAKLIIPMICLATPMIIKKKDTR